MSDHRAGCSGPGAAELVELLAESLELGVPLGESLLRLAAALLPLGRGAPIRLRLPLGLVSLCPRGELAATWRNELHVFYYRDYEQLPGFRPGRGWIVVDAGAYVGLYTLRAARLVGPRGLVVSLEPLPESFAYLAANVRLNGLRNVVPLRACLAGSSGVRTLYVPESTVNATLVKEYAETVGGTWGEVGVRALTLGDIVERLGHVDLLKLDIEGAEAEVLESPGLDPHRVRRVVVEVHVDVVGPSEVAGLLEDAGYETALYVDESAPHQAFVYAAEALPV